MAYNPIKIGILLQPSIRGMAYISMFRALNIYPEEVILMKGNIGNLHEVRAEDNLFDYSGQFFDLRYDLIDYVNNCGAHVINCSSNDINGTEIRKAIIDCSNEHFIFTGGGILHKNILSAGKKFIHVHPGIVPDYRGSTCFYYSILDRGTVGATAFIMDEHIDTGDTILCSEFRLNYRILSEQPLFIDYIVDPYIRAITLKKVLVHYLKHCTMTTHLQEPATKTAYYIAHPLLRHIAIRRVNDIFNDKSDKGIIEINGGQIWT